MYPTYLYIKRHKLTGLKYFGKTTSDDPISYTGSGTYWLSHINKHGRKEIETLWTKLFEDEHELMEYALRFSIENKIVESDEWANLTLETGVDGLPKGYKFSDEHRKNLSESQKGVPKPGTSTAMIGNTLRKGTKFTKEQSAKLSASKIGNKNRLGVPHTEESKRGCAKGGLAQKGIPKKTIQCPHCAKVGGAGNMKRYHFEFCKVK